MNNTVVLTSWCVIMVLLLCGVISESLLMRGASVVRRANGSKFVAVSSATSTFLTRKLHSANNNDSAAAPASRSEEEMKEIKLKREQRKAAKEAAKKEKAAKKKALAAQRQEEEEKEKISNAVSFTDLDECCGDYAVVRSKTDRVRSYTKIRDTTASSSPSEERVWLRCRLHSLRINSNSVFLKLRQNSISTMQACFFKNDHKEDKSYAAKMLKYMKDLPEESIVDVCGVVVPADVKSCTVKDREIKVEKIHAVSRASSILPFQLEDASRSKQEIEESLDTERPYANIGQELRLDNRWIDLRVPSNNSIMKVKSGICQLYRESLYGKGFTEIHTPKLIGGESESGAGVFKTDYFGSEGACVGGCAFFVCLFVCLSVFVRFQIIA